jgi:hypothetical protein
MASRMPNKKDAYSKDTYSAQRSIRGNFPSGLNHTGLALILKPVTFLSSLISHSPLSISARHTHSSRVLNEQRWVSTTVLLHDTYRVFVHLGENRLHLFMAPFSPINGPPQITGQSNLQMPRWAWGNIFSAYGDFPCTGRALSNVCHLYLALNGQNSPLRERFNRFRDDF